MTSAWKKHDLESWKSVYHADYEFVSHADGKTVTHANTSDNMMLGMMEIMKFKKQRCIYEDDNVLVENSLSTYGSGAKEAVITVHSKKRRPDYTERGWRHSSVRFSNL